MVVEGARGRVVHVHVPRFVSHAAAVETAQSVARAFAPEDVLLLTTLHGGSAAGTMKEVLEYRPGPPWWARALGLSRLWEPRQGAK